MITPSLPDEGVLASGAVSLDDAMLVNDAVEVILKNKIASSNASCTISDKEWEESGISLAPQQCNEIWATLCNNSWTLAEQKLIATIDSRTIPQYIELMPLARMAYQPKSNLPVEHSREVRLSRIISTKSYLGPGVAPRLKKRAKTANQTSSSRKASKVVASDMEDEKGPQREPDGQTEGGLSAESNPILADPQPSASSSCEEAERQSGTEVMETDAAGGRQESSVEAAVSESVDGLAPSAASEDGAALQAAPTTIEELSVTADPSSVAPSDSIQDDPGEERSQGAEGDAFDVSSSVVVIGAQADYCSV